ncbi:GNAT family N-acetyltransferase [Caenimonas aquaedulcis]|uniref:GNAT family N-acetyltransferase n=1 Tax=Caenimonas aquaedulcis TaxID=2793270 RepID=A0A931MH18_9BURK|nr:GNAT family N-acetyltransferase [Caenimonas aquaedulcis]MBG9387800.1 GNAT family N-acetyltransferase [Caenimonas aquaedulcis]
MTTYQVRPAADKDADAVAAVHASSSHAAYEAVAPEGVQSLPMEKRRAFWRDAIEYGEPLVHVALEGSKIIGFVGYDRSRDPKSKPTTGEIWALYVDPARWDTGAGLALWDAAREGLIEEGCTEVTVWMPLCNERALRFLELAGFKRELNTAKTAVMGGVKLEEIRLKRPLD